MKKIGFLVLSLTLSTLHAENAFEIPTFTELVYKRYYFIARLEKTMEFFSYLKERHFFIIDEACIKKLYAYKYHFSNEVVLKTIDQLAATSTVEPLFESWLEFRAYKYLVDEIFLQEFTKLILLFSERVLSHAIQHQEELLFSVGKIQAIVEYGLRAREAERLDYIDEIIDFLQKIITTSSALLPTKSLPDQSTYIQQNYTQAVSQRLYLFNRLQKPVSLILAFHKKPLVCFELLRNCHLVFDKKITFTHERVHECINTMEEECSLKPFFDLWHDFKHYKYLDDELFIRELSKVVFILEKNIITNGLSQKPIQRNSFDYLLALYEKIDSLPLEEILNAIDMLSQELPLISQKYELETDMSWKQWFKKYWWAPPLILATIGLKLLLTVKNAKLLMNLLVSSPQEDNLEDLEVAPNEKIIQPDHMVNADTPLKEHD